MWCPHFNLVSNHRCKFSQHNSKYFSFSFSSCSIAALCAAQVDPTRYIYCFVLLLWFVYINHGEQIFTRFPPLPILLPNTRASNIFAGSTFLAALNQLKRLFPSSIVFIFPQEEDILCFTLLPTPPRLSSHPSGKRSTEKRNTIPARLCWTSYSCLSVSKNEETLCYHFDTL